MKATLEFNLDDPSDENAFKRASSSTGAYLTLWEIENEVFRPARKHGYRDTEPHMNILTWSDDTYAVVETLQQKFYDILEKHGVDLNDLE